MNPLRRMRLEVLLLSELAIAAFCVSQRSIGLFLLAGGLAALSWYVVEGPRARIMPRWLNRTLMSAIVAYSAWDWFASPDPAGALSVLGRFAMWLAVLKLYEVRRARDDAQLLALSAVLVVSGTLHTADLLFAVLLFVYCLEAVRVAMLVQLRVVRESSNVPGGPVAGRRFPAQLRGTAWLTSVGAIGVAMVVFVLFPRRLDPQGDRLVGATPVSGFVEEVDLFSGDRINESRREVLSVRWLDRAGESLEFSKPMLLRGSVMSDYLPASHRWTVAPGARRTRTVTVRSDLEMTPLSLPPVRPRSETYRQQVNMKSIVSDVVFAALNPIGISAGERRSFAFDVESFVIRELGLERVSRLQQYEVQIEPFPGPDTLAPLFGANGALIPPLPDFPVARIREIAEAALAEQNPPNLPPAAAAAVDPAQRWVRNRIISRTLETWLRDGGRFAYTTDLSSFVRTLDEDPIVSFLDRQRFGHCEYFASALTALCQSVGVDARLVTGYIAMEWDPSTAQYVVRESHAHAWVEVRLGGYYWSPLDPTPTESLEAMAAMRRSWLDDWRWVYDRVDLFWNSRIVSYDGFVQASLADRLAQAWSDRLGGLTEGFRRRFDSMTSGLRLGSAAATWVGAIVVMLAAGLAALTITLGRRRWIRRRAGLPRAAPRGDVAAAELLIEAMEAWARAGWVRPAWQPPRSFLASLPVSSVDAIADTRALIDLYYRVRFAGSPAGVTELRRSRLRLKRLRESLSSGPLGMTGAAV